MKFRQFVIAAADQIGRQHLPVRDTAHEIDEFVGPDSVHDDLAVKLVRAIYRANRCGHLDASINANDTFDALGSSHGKLLRDQRTDLEQIRFVQALGDVAFELFHGTRTTERSNKSASDTDERHTLNTNPTDRTGTSQKSEQPGVIQFQR